METVCWKPRKGKEGGKFVRVVKDLGTVQLIEVYVLRKILIWGKFWVQVSHLPVRRRRGAARGRGVEEPVNYSG